MINSDVIFLLKSVVLYHSSSTQAASKAHADRSAFRFVNFNIQTCKMRVREKKIFLLTNANVLLPIDTAHTTCTHPPVVIACICMTQLATVGGEHSRPRGCCWRSLGQVLTSRSCPSAVLHLSGLNAVLLMC